MASTVHPLKLQEEPAVEAAAVIELVLNVEKKAIFREIAPRQAELLNASLINHHRIPTLTSLSKDLTLELLLEVGAMLLELEPLEHATAKGLMEVV